MKRQQYSLAFNCNPPNDEILDDKMREGREKEPEDWRRRGRTKKRKGKKRISPIASASSSLPPENPSRPPLLLRSSNARCSVRRATDSRVSRGSPFKRHYVTLRQSRASDGAFLHWTSAAQRTCRFVGARHTLRGEFKRVIERVTILREKER